MSVDLELKDLERVDAELIRIHSKLPIEIEYVADEMAERVKAKAYQYCPKRTWRLADSLRIVRQGVIRRIVAGGIVVRGRLVDYAAPVEYGHVTKLGTWVPPQSFIRRALEEDRNMINNQVKVMWRSLFE